MNWSCLMATFPVYGTSFLSGEKNVPVTFWDGHWYNAADLAIVKDRTKAKKKAIEKPVDDFNRLIRKSRDML